MYWLSFRKKREEPVTGLILPGGGARNAYQAGVLKGIADMLPRDAEYAVRVICGASSGALNAVLLASNANRFQDGMPVSAVSGRTSRSTRCFARIPGQP